MSAVTFEGFVGTYILAFFLYDFTYINIFIPCNICNNTSRKTTADIGEIFWCLIWKIFSAADPSGFLQWTQKYLVIFNNNDVNDFFFLSDFLTGRLTTKQCHFLRSFFLFGKILQQMYVNIWTQKMHPKKSIWPIPLWQRWLVMVLVNRLYEFQFWEAPLNNGLNANWTRFFFIFLNFSW